MESTAFKYTITVLMAVYNTPFALIKRAVDSVLNQDFSDFELIILDDGSDLDIQHKLISYAIEHEDKITYLRHKNRSQSDTINRGVKLSNSKYITVIDADDEYKPNHLSSCLAEIGTHDLINTTTHTVVNNSNDYFVPDRFDYNKLIHVDECILFATMFGKKEVFSKIQFKNMYASDADFFDRVQQTYAVKKVDLRTYIYYRDNKQSITETIKSKIKVGA